LEKTTFRFPVAGRVGVFYSLSQSAWDCKVHMVYPATWRRGLTFKFVRDGKEVLSIEGHTRSEFRAKNNVLYFADFLPSAAGCSVAAYDLKTGKKLWKTELNAAGCLDHSAYSNEVSMDLGLEEHGIVTITGREAYGDYIEVLDRKTGKVLAHKRYRTGFE